MSTVSATNTTTAVSDLMQAFSASAPPAIASLLSSTKVESALDKASPADLVQLSDQAMQMQEVNGLFGSAASTSESEAESESPGMMMQNLLKGIYAPTGASATSGSNVNLTA